ncbi:hypothetical protein [Nevskia sp.]|nr:hypothetical protein [Nevskia sp.]
MNTRQHREVVLNDDAVVVGFAVHASIATDSMAALMVIRFGSSRTG